MRSIRAPYLLAVSLLSLLILSCGSAGDATGDGHDTGASETNEETEDFRIILAGAATDTLSGNATFGYVINPRTRREELVVKLATGVDFSGGVFLVRGVQELPEARTYPLVNVVEKPDSVLGDGFMVAYQEGLLRRLHSRQGSVTFTHVSDSLIVGSVEATLWGVIAPPGGGALREDELHMSGRFEAERDIVGFIVGI